MDVLNYLLLINIYLVLFYAFYALFLKNETFFKLNRFYLVGGATMSFLIPFLQSDWIRSLFITRQVKEVTLNITYVFGGPELVIQAEEKTWGTGEILMFIYLAGAAFFLLRFLRQLYRLQVILRSSQTDHAFSFFNKVMVGSAIPNRETVYDHEMVHARQWHSADVVLFEIISIINWFNPVVYLYRKAIKHIHEYTADEIASRLEESKAAYAMVLVSKTFGVSSHQLTNSFYNHSLLKRRILMLHKSKSTRNALLKYGLSAPLFAVMMILSSASFKTQAAAERLIDVSSDALEIIQQDTSALDSKYQLFLEQNPSVASLEWKSGSQVVVILKSGQKETYDLSNSTELKKAEEVYGSFPFPPPPPPPMAPGNNTLQVTKGDDGQAYSQVDQMPEPIGGFKTFYDYIINNFKYPAAAKEKSVAGKVILQMVVEADGKLTDIKVLRGLGSGLDEEAVRVLNQSPVWKPGIQDGKPVRVQFTLPISVSAPGQKTGSTIDRIEDGMLVSDIPQNALFILDGKEVERDVIDNMDSKSFKLVNILRSQWALDKYGQKGKNGVVEIYVNNTPPGSAATAVKTLGSTGITIKSNKLDVAGYKGLTILDGAEITNLTLKKLDPKTIQTMNVLKGESAVTKYGSRGKEGVVEVYTYNSKATGSTSQGGGSTAKTVTYSAPDSITLNKGDITLQGRGSKVDLGDYDGLILLDGLEVNNTSMKKINSESIESVNVLKGESAVKKYGSRAKEGAIEITTKKD